MIKFGKGLVEHERKLIEQERKRAILFLSKINNLKIWINIWIEHDRKVISGVVNSIINGTYKKNKHLLLGGRFSFDDNVEYLFDDIYAISFEPFSLEEEAFRKDWIVNFNSSIYGDEANRSCFVLFSDTDLKPQNFNVNTPLDQFVPFGGVFRNFNSRYYEIISRALKK
ncbi:MAG: hypothetical protein HZB33_01970 [Nitrospirae bacterium]|nr:hypothetical protein [Nitrospirota bacterium]